MLENQPCYLFMGHLKDWLPKNTPVKLVPAVNWSWKEEVLLSCKFFRLESKATLQLETVQFAKHKNKPTFMRAFENGNAVPSIGKQTRIQ